MKVAILPELQQTNNRHINRALRGINVILFLLITVTLLVGLTTYRNIHQAQNSALIGTDGSVIGNATLMVPNWIIVPAKVEHDAKLLLSHGGEIPANLVRVQSVNGIDVALLRGEGIPAELLLNAADLVEDESVFIVDNGAEWTGRLKKRPDGLYEPGGDRQFPPGLAVTTTVDHTALVGITATSSSGPVVITIQQLQQAFPEMK
jgi:hypothetical protein